jgi:hypothetical protein
MLARGDFAHDFAVAVRASRALSVMLGVEFGAVLRGFW